MEVALFWVVTIIISYMIAIDNGLRIHKDAADAGYKINSRKVNRAQEELYSDEIRSKSIIRFVPGLNILYSLFETVQYFNTRNSLLDQYNVMGALEELSELEKEEYAKKPDCITALLLPNIVEKRLKRAAKMAVKTPNAMGLIYYEIGDSANDIKILSSTGTVSKLSIQEQKNEVIKRYNGYKVILKDKIDSEYKKTDDKLNKEMNRLIEDMAYDIRSREKEEKTKTKKFGKKN